MTSSCIVLNGAGIGSLCGGEDEHEHETIQAEFDDMVNGMAHALLKTLVNEVEVVGFQANVTPSIFAAHCAPILEAWLQNVARLWVPLLRTDCRDMGLQTSAVQVYTSSVLGRPEYEVGKSSGLMSTTDAYRFAEKV
jgi:hypothetical protein